MKKQLLWQLLSASLSPSCKISSATGASLSFQRQQVATKIKSKITAATPSASPNPPRGLRRQRTHPSGLGICCSQTETCQSQVTQLPGRGRKQECWMVSTVKPLQCEIRAGNSTTGGSHESRGLLGEGPSTPARKGSPGSGLRDTRGSPRLGSTQGEEVCLVSPPFSEDLASSEVSFSRSMFWQGLGIF